MTPADQIVLLKDNVEKWNQWRQENPKRVANLRYADLKGLNLTNADFDRIDLTEANLSGAILNGATFRRANLTEVNLSKTSLIDCDFSGADLREVDLSGAILQGVNLSGCRLYKTNLSQAQILNVNTSRMTAWQIDTSGLQQASLYLVENEQRLIFDNIELAEPLWRQIADKSSAGFDNFKMKLALLVGHFPGGNYDRLIPVISDLTERGYTAVLADNAGGNGESLSRLLTGFSEVAALVVADFTATDNLLPDLEAVMAADALNLTIQPIVVEGDTREDWDHLGEKHQWFLPIHRFVAPDEDLIPESPESATNDDMADEPETAIETEAEVREEESPVSTEVVSETEDLAEQENFATAEAETAELDELLDPQEIDPEETISGELAALSEEELAEAVEAYMPSGGETPPGGAGDDTEEVSPEVSEEVVSDSDTPESSQETAAGDLELDIDDSMFRISPADDQPETETEAEELAEEADEKAGDNEAPGFSKLLEEAFDEEESSTAESPVAETGVEESEVSEQDETEAVDFEEHERMLMAETAGDEGKAVDEELPESGESDESPVETEAVSDEVEFPAPLEVKIVDDEAAGRKERFRRNRNQTRERWQQFFSLVIVVLPLLLIAYGIYYWQTGYVDVTIEIPESAKAYVYVDDRPVERGQTLDGMAQYQVPGLWADQHQVRIMPTQLKDIQNREFARLKSMTRGIDVQRSGENIFRFSDFDTLYQVKAVANGKFPNIDGSGEKIVFLRRNNTRLKESPLREVYVKNLQTEEEQKIRMRRTPQIDFEQPYFAAGNDRILLNSPDVDRAFFVKTGDDSLFSVPLPPGYFNAIPRRDTSGFILQNKTFDATGKAEKTFYPRVPVGNAVFVAGSKGILLVEEEQGTAGRRALRFDCTYIHLPTQDSRVLFKLRKGQTPYLSGSNNGDRVTISEYVGLNFEISTTIKLWENDIIVDLTPPFKDGRRAFADASGFHMTQANIDDSGRKIVYEYESVIYLLEFSESATTAEIAQSTL